MLHFFSIILIILIIILLLVFKKIKIKNVIDRKNLYSRKSNNNTKNIANTRFSYVHEEKEYSKFFKNTQRKKMFKLFKSNRRDKLKALKIAEDLADKSTLPILRKGLRDTCPEIVKISATLIKNFK